MRKPIALQVRLAFDDVSDFTERYATNISEGGIFIRSRDPRPVGSRLTFELRLRSGEVAFAGEGIVRWVQGLDARGLGVPGMGLQFEHLTDESRAVLARVLAERSKDTEVVDAANPSRWRPLEEFPPVEEEPLEEEEPPPPPPVLAPVAGFVPVDRPEVTAPLLPPGARSQAGEAVVGAGAWTTATGDRPAVGLQLQATGLRVASGAWTELIPAAVAVTSTGGLLFGAQAVEALANGAMGTRGLGSLLGLRPGTAAARAWQRRYLLPVVAGDDGQPALAIGGGKVAAATLCEELFRHALSRVQLQAGAEPGRAVIAHAAGLSQTRRRALKEVALSCGLELERLVPAPLLSVLARFGGDGQRRVLVVAVAEALVEVAVVEQSDHVLDLATSAATAQIGGEDLDLAVVGSLLTQFEKDTEAPVPEDLGIFERVRQAASEARETLSDQLETEVFVPKLLETGLSRCDLRQKLTRARLQTMAAPLVERVLELVRSVLAQRSLGPRDIDEVVLAGQYARLPFLSLRLRELFGREPGTPAHDPFEVARGAAQAAEGHSAFARYVLTGSVTLPLWVEPVGGPPKRLLDRGAALPVSSTYVAVAEEGARALELGLFQGERGTVDEDPVGTLVVGPIPAPPPGERVRAVISVTLDDSGELTFQAKAMHGAEVPAVLDRSRMPVSHFPRSETG